MMKIEFLNDNYTCREIVTMSNSKSFIFLKENSERLNSYSFYSESFDGDSIVEFKFINRPYIRVIGNIHELHELCVKLARQLKFSRFEYSEKVFNPNGKLQTSSERTVWTR